MDQKPAGTPQAAAPEAALPANQPLWWGHAMNCSHRWKQVQSQTVLLRCATSNRGNAAGSASRPTTSRAKLLHQLRSRA